MIAADRRGIVLGFLCAGVLCTGVVGGAACGWISGASDLSANPTQVEDAGGASSGASSASSSGASGTSGATSSSSSSSSSSGDADPGAPADLLTCTANGLLAYWKIDEGTGSIVKDCGPNKVNGTLTAGLSWVMGRNGKGSALEFSGDSAPGANLLALDPSTASALQTTGALTVSLWIFKVTDPRGSMIGRAQSQQRTAWALAYENNVIRASMRDQNTLDVRAEIRNVAPMTWHHVAMVFRPSTALEIWHNGGLADASDRMVPAATPDYGALKIGHIDDPTDAFGHLNGRIQHVRLFGRALSAAEIAVLANEPN